MTEQALLNHPEELIRKNQERDLELRIRAEMETEYREKVEGRKGGFQNFAMLNLDPKIFEVMYQVSTKQPKAFAIFLYIIQNMSKTNALICSYAVLQEKFDISRTTASKAVKYLKDVGLLYVYKSGTTNVYVTNPELVWKSSGNNRKHCKFPANIIITSSEQSNFETNYYKAVEVKEQE